MYGPLKTLEILILMTFTVFILSVELSTRSKLEDKLSKMNELLLLQDEVEMTNQDSNPVQKQLIDKETFVLSRKLEGLKPSTPAYKTSQATPMPKLNVQNRCPAKIKLEEFQENDEE